MKTQFCNRVLLRGFFVLITLFMLAACGGGQAAKSDSSRAFTENPLDSKYNVVLLQKVEIDPKIEVDYPTAVTDYENNVLSELRAKNLFREVDRQSTPGPYGQNTLLVKSKVQSLRVVSGSTRFWFGAAAGTSDMSVEIKLIDAKTGNILREKVLSTANNPFAAVFAGGSSDRSLPADMGKIAATYILAVTAER
jgi:hypothetical protein